MPTYVVECPFCLRREDILRTVAERDSDLPKCHNRSMRRVITKPMVSIFHPYMPVAGEQEDGSKHMIRTKAEHEAFLRRNGYEEVGTDKSMAPPSAEELAARKQAWRDAPDAPMVDVEKLKREGWIEEDLV